MLTKDHLPASFLRLRELATALGRELAIWQQAQHKLTSAELAVNREALLDAIQGLEKGAGVLEKVLMGLGKG